MYQLTEDGVKRLEDNAFIPSDPRNCDWQDYQQWLTEGNEPLPAPVALSNVAVSNGYARQSRLDQQSITAVNNRLTALEDAVGVKQTVWNDRVRQQNVLALKERLIQLEQNVLNLKAGI